MLCDNCDQTFHPQPSAGRKWIHDLIYGGASKDTTRQDGLTAVSCQAHFRLQLWLCRCTVLLPMELLSGYHCQAYSTLQFLQLLQAA
jgi:hypothetical protein